MNDRIYKLAYDEAVCDMMLELCICESQAKDRLNNLIKDKPEYLESLYKQFYSIRQHLEIR
tara:strand:- start:758 stop:940 length:183 start_codon:yes stop_codon:yes gene_type:complete